MKTTSNTFLTTVGVLAVLVPLAACSVDVTKGASGKDSEVDIRTPAGDMSVRRDVNAAREIGLPIYPGAVAARDRGEESGNVNIGTAWFGLKVVAAKFESDDAPESVLDFYKKEMRTYGSVIECRGNVDFRGNKGAKQPVCREKGSPSTDVQLITGTEDRQRIAAVKRRGSGSEFSLVYVETRDGS